jgi:hypothetical protein
MRISDSLHASTFSLKIYPDEARSSHAFAQEPMTSFYFSESRNNPSISHKKWKNPMNKKKTLRLWKENARNPRSPLKVNQPTH